MELGGWSFGAHPARTYTTMLFCVCESLWEVHRERFIQDGCSVGSLVLEHTDTIITATETSRKGQTDAGKFRFFLDRAVIPACCANLQFSYNLIYYSAADQLYCTLIL